MYIRPSFVSRRPNAATSASASLTAIPHHSHSFSRRTSATAASPPCRDTASREAAREPSVTRGYAREPDYWPGLLQHFRRYEGARVPYPFFEVFRIQRPCFMNNAFQKSPRKEIKDGEVRTPRGPWHRTTPPHPTSRKKAIRFFARNICMVRRSAILLEPHVPQHRKWYVFQKDRQNIPQEDRIGFSIKAMCNTQ